MRTNGRSGTVHVGPAEGRAVRMADAQLYTRKVSSEQTGGAFSLFEVAVAPEGGSPPHVQHREDECFWVLDGAFEFLVEGVKVGADAGSLIYIPKGELHAFENVGGRVGRLLVLQTPGGTHERFLEEAGEPATLGSESSADGGAPPTKGSQEAGTLARFAVEYGVELVPP